MEKRKLIEKTSKQLNESQKKELDKEYKVSIHNRDFFVLPNVFSPKYFKDSDFFSQNIPVIKNGSFLEIGSGTGVIAIFAALRGAKKVVATDINPNAVKNTLKNVRFHNLQNKISVRLGDLFDPVQEEMFDQIFWNVPFLCSKNCKLTILEQSTFDYRDLKKEKFIQEAKKYLTPKGKLFIGYSSNYGDIQKILSLLKKNKYSVKVIVQTKQDFAGGFINLEIIEAVPNIKIFK